MCVGVFVEDRGILSRIGLVNVQRSTWMVNPWTGMIPADHWFSPMLRWVLVNYPKKKKQSYTAVRASFVNPFDHPMEKIVIEKSDMMKLSFGIRLYILQFLDARKHEDEDLPLGHYYFKDDKSKVKYRTMFPYSRPSFSAWYITLKDITESDKSMRGHVFTSVLAHALQDVRYECPNCDIAREFKVVLVHDAHVPTTAVFDKAYIDDASGFDPSLVDFLHKSNPPPLTYPPKKWTFRVRHIVTYRKGIGFQGTLYTLSNKLKNFILAPNVSFTLLALQIAKKSEVEQLEKFFASERRLARKIIFSDVTISAFHVQALDTLSRNRLDVKSIHLFYTNEAINIIEDKHMKVLTECEELVHVAIETNGKCSEKNHETILNSIKNLEPLLFCVCNNSLVTPKHFYIWIKSDSVMGIQYAKAICEAFPKTSKCPRKFVIDFTDISNPQLFLVVEELLKINSIAKITIRMLVTSDIFNNVERAHKSLLQKADTLGWEARPTSIDNYHDFYVNKETKRGILSCTITPKQ